MTTAIHIDLDSPSIHRIKLGEDVYDVRVPKAMFLLDMAKLRNMESEEDVAQFGSQVKKLVRAIFQPSDVKKIYKRLRDPSDPLDLEHIMSLVDKLMEVENPENPTM